MRRRQLFKRTVRRSRNDKVGPLFCVSADPTTCPPGCPLRGDRGCYGQNYRARRAWQLLADGTRGETFERTLERIEVIPDGETYRYGDVGDLPGRGNRISARMLHQLARASQRKDVISYTHKPVLGSSQVARKNRELVRWANDHGFTVNLSALGVGQADALHQLDIAPVFVALRSDQPIPKRTPAGVPIVWCPSQKGTAQCATCCKGRPWCAQADRTPIIAIRSHGSRFRAVDRAINAMEARFGRC